MRVIIVVNVLQAENAQVTMRDETYLEVTTDDGSICESVTQYLAVTVERENGELLPLRLCRVQGRNRWQVRYNDDRHGLDDLKHTHRWVRELISDRQCLMDLVAAGCVFSVLVKTPVDNPAIRVGDELRVEPHLSVSVDERVFDADSELNGKLLGKVTMIRVFGY